MYEQFTDRARKVMQLANKEAQRFNHAYVGTEHILLGLASEGTGVAANVLKNLGVDLREIRIQVEKLVQSGPDMVTMGKLPQTPRAKKVIEYAIEESQLLHHNYAGTEHILLGLLREEETVAAQVLMNLGLRLEDVRAAVLAILGQSSEHEKRELEFRKCHTMRRTVSSAQTFFMKCVFPPIWIGLFGMGTCALWFGALQGRNGPPPEPMKWIFLVTWLVGSGFILWFCGRIKRLQVDDEALYVSNYWSEVRIPLVEVSHFTRSRWINPATVTIHLRDMSPYGERIVFIPKARWFPFGSHPIVTELQALCDRAQGKEGTGTAS